MTDRPAHVRPPAVRPFVRPWYVAPLVGRWVVRRRKVNPQRGDRWEAPVESCRTQAEAIRAGQALAVRDGTFLHVQNRRGFTRQTMDYRPDRPRGFCG